MALRFPVYLACPHCGANFRLAPEQATDDQHAQCPKCGKVFSLLSPPPPPPTPPAREQGGGPSAPAAGGIFPAGGGLDAGATFTPANAPTAPAGPAAAPSSAPGAAIPVAGGAPSPAVGEKPQRRYARYPLNARSILYTERRAQIFGHTVDVSYKSAFVRFCSPNPRLRKGEYAVLQIAIHDYYPIDENFVPFLCRADRITHEGVGLTFVDSRERETLMARLPGTSSIFIRRNSGVVEPGWETMPHNHPLPAGLEKKVRLFEQKGPVAICYKKDRESGAVHYKIVGLQELITLQQLARQGEER